MKRHSNYAEAFERQVARERQLKKSQEEFATQSLKKEDKRHYPIFTDTSDFQRKK